MAEDSVRATDQGVARWRRRVRTLKLLLGVVAVLTGEMGVVWLVTGATPLRALVAAVLVLLSATGAAAGIAVVMIAKAGLVASAMKKAAAQHAFRSVMQQQAAHSAAGTAGSPRSASHEVH